MVHVISADCTYDLGGLYMYCPVQRAPPVVCILRRVSQGSASILSGPVREGRHVRYVLSTRTGGWRTVLEVGYARGGCTIRTKYTYLGFVYGTYRVPGPLRLRFMKHTVFALENFIVIHGGRISARLSAGGMRAFHADRISVGRPLLIGAKWPKCSLSVA